MLNYVFFCFDVYRPDEYEDYNKRLMGWNLNEAKKFAYTLKMNWKGMGNCDENVLIFYSLTDNTVCNKLLGALQRSFTLPCLKATTLVSQ